MTDQSTAVAERPSGVSFANIGIGGAAVGASGALAPETLGEVVAFAKLMATAQHAIPKHLRENPGACMAVTLQALRWEMDPFAVAAKTYMVRDQLAYEAQVIAAVVNTRANLKSRPKIEFEGEGAARVCVVTMEFANGDVRMYASPEIGKITTKNSPLWQTDPDQQLGYYSIRSAARRHCPEVILGVYDRDEIEQSEPLRNVTPAAGTGMVARLAAQGATVDADGFNVRKMATEIGEPKPKGRKKKDDEPETIAAKAKRADAADAEFTADVLVTVTESDPVIHTGPVGTFGTPDLDATLDNDQIPDFAAPDVASEGADEAVRPAAGDQPSPAEPDAPATEAAQEPQEAVFEDAAPDAPENPAPATEPAPSQPSKLAEATAAYRSRLKAAPSTPMLDRIRNNNSGLRAELDKHDPEALVELEELFNDRWTELKETEKKGE